MKRLTVPLILVPVFVSAQLISTLRLDVEGSATNATQISGAAITTVENIMAPKMNRVADFSTNQTLYAAIIADALTLSTYATIPTTPGALWFDGLDLNMATPYPGTVLQVGKEMIADCENVTGETITDGQVVYVSGNTTGSADQKAVRLATVATAISSRGAVGVATADIADGVVGPVTFFGDVNRIPAGVGWTNGAALYLNHVAGDLTLEPSEAFIGRVIRVYGQWADIFVRPDYSVVLSASAIAAAGGITNGAPVSALTNDAGYLTEEADPGFAAWLATANLDDALRLIQSDTNSWFVMENGTAVVYRVTYELMEDTDVIILAGSLAADGTYTKTIDDEYGEVYKGGDVKWIFPAATWAVVDTLGFVTFYKRAESPIGTWVSEVPEFDPPPTGSYGQKLGPVTNTYPLALSADLAAKYDASNPAGFLDAAGVGALIAPPMYQPIATTITVSGTNTVVALDARYPLYRIVAGQSTAVSFDTSGLTLTDNAASWRTLIEVRGTNTFVTVPSTNAVRYLDTVNLLTSAAAPTQTVAIVWEAIRSIDGATTNVVANPYDKRNGGL